MWLMLVTTVSMVYMALPPSLRMMCGRSANSPPGTGMVPRGVCPADLVVRTCSEPLQIAARCGRLAPIPVTVPPKGATCLLRRMPSSLMVRTGRLSLQFVMPASIRHSIRSKSSRHPTSGRSVVQVSSFSRSDGMVRSGRELRQPMGIQTHPRTNPSAIACTASTELRPVYGRLGPLMMPRELSESYRTLHLCISVRLQSGFDESNTDSPLYVESGE